MASRKTFESPVHNLVNLWKLHGQPMIKFDEFLAAVRYQDGTPAFGSAESKKKANASKQTLKRNAKQSPLNVGLIESEYKVDGILKTLLDEVDEYDEPNIDLPPRLNLGANDGGLVLTYGGRILSDNIKEMLPSMHFKIPARCSADMPLTLISLVSRNGGDWTDIVKITEPLHSHADSEDATRYSYEFESQRAECNRGNIYYQPNSERATHVASATLQRPPTASRPHIATKSRLYRLPCDESGNQIYVTNKNWQGENHQEEPDNDTDVKTYPITLPVDEHDASGNPVTSYRFYVAAELATSGESTRVNKKNLPRQHQPQTSNSNFAFGTQGVGAPTSAAPTAFTGQTPPPPSTPAAFVPQVQPPTQSNSNYFAFGTQQGAGLPTSAAPTATHFTPPPPSTPAAYVPQHQSQFGTPAYTSGAPTAFTGQPPPPPSTRAAFVPQVQPPTQRNNYFAFGTQQGAGLPTSAAPTATHFAFAPQSGQAPPPPFTPAASVPQHQFQFSTPIPTAQSQGPQIAFGTSQGAQPQTANTSFNFTAPAVNNAQHQPQTQTANTSFNFTPPAANNAHHQPQTQTANSSFNFTPPAVNNAQHQPQTQTANTSFKFTPPAVNNAQHQPQTQTANTSFKFTPPAANNAQHQPPIPRTVSSTATLSQSESKALEVEKNELFVNLNKKFQNDEQQLLRTLAMASQTDRNYAKKLLISKYDEIHQQQVLELEEEFMTRKSPHIVASLFTGQPGSSSSAQSTQQAVELAVAEREAKMEEEARRLRQMELDVTAKLAELEDKQVHFDSQEARLLDQLRRDYREIGEAEKRVNRQVEILLQRRMNDRDVSAADSSQMEKSSECSTEDTGYESQAQTVTFQEELEAAASTTLISMKRHVDSTDSLDQLEDNASEKEVSREIVDSNDCNRCCTQLGDFDTLEGEKFSTGTGDNSLSGIESMLDGEEEDREQQQEQVDQQQEEDGGVERRHDSVNILMGIIEDRRQEEKMLLKSQRKRQLITIDTPMKRRRTLEEEKVQKEEEREQAKRLRTLEEEEERKLLVTKKRKGVHLDLATNMQVKRLRLDALSTGTENNSELLPELERGLYTIQEEEEQEVVEELD